MGRTREISRAKAGILIEGLDDSAVRAASLEVVEDVLEEGLMRPGFATRGGGFEVLRKTHCETLERVEREWDELGRAPDVGEGIWFDLTEKGEERARKLKESAV